MAMWDRIRLAKANEVRREVNALLRAINRGERTYTSVILELRERLARLEAQVEVEEVRLAGLQEAEDSGMVPNYD